MFLASLSSFQTTSLSPLPMVSRMMFRTNLSFAVEPDKVIDARHDRMKLVILDAATSINDLRIPLRNRLEELKENRKGQHSIRINNQWRICFEWRNGDSFNVEIVDYH